MEPPVKIIRALIVDDHQMVRDGLKVMLESKKKTNKFEIDEAENGDNAIKTIQEKNFDIVLLDYQLPDMKGSEILRTMRTHKKELKVLALSNHDDVATIKEMMNEGVNGYILKNIEPSQLIQAIEAVMAGGSYYSNEVAVKLIDDANNPDKPIKANKSDLTDRELEVLRFIALEHTNDQISKKLHISKRTVDTHRQHLLKKLHVKNTAGLIKAAIMFKLLE